MLLGTTELAVDDDFHGMGAYYVITEAEGHGITEAVSNVNAVFTMALNPRCSVNEGPHDGSIPYCATEGPTT